MLMRELFRAQELVMEMQMGMDSLWFHLNPRLPPAFSGQEAFSYYPAFAAAVMTNNKRDVDPTPPPPPPSRSKAAARKDRHSKICTAGGRRNRRMRLPQDVARRFFALQENLGFDRASKTMQWLLDKSTAGINHLIGTTASMSLSEEDGSVLLDLDNNDHIMVANAETNKQQMMPKAKRRSTPAAPRKNSNNGGATVLLLPDKASRARARERARERTKERNCLRSEAPAPARQLVVPVLPVACSNSYYEVEQEPWELGEVVFAKPYLCFN